jgi:hypothetical protein
VPDRRIPSWLYDLVARDASYQCGYCRAPQRVLPYRLEIEHLLPRSLGGQEDRDNLWLSCHRCNKLRSNLMEVTDPLTTQEVPIVNPRRHRWADHFVWAEGGLLIVGQTQCGRGTVEVLKLNDRYHLSARGVWVIAQMYPPE